MSVVEYTGGQNSAVGSFTEDQHKICNGAAVTHSDGSSKSSVDIEWISPLDASGRTFNVLWVVFTYSSHGIGLGGVAIFNRMQYSIMIWKQYIWWIRFEDFIYVLMFNRVSLNFSHKNIIRITLFLDWRQHRNWLIRYFDMRFVWISIPNLVYWPVLLGIRLWMAWQSRQVNYVYTRGSSTTSSYLLSSLWNGPGLGKSRKTTGFFSFFDLNSNMITLHSKPG